MRGARIQFTGAQSLTPAHKKWQLRVPKISNGAGENPDPPTRASVPLSIQNTNSIQISAACWKRKEIRAPEKKKQHDTRACIEPPNTTKSIRIIPTGGPHTERASVSLEPLFYSIPTYIHAYIHIDRRRRAAAVSLARRNNRNGIVKTYSRALFHCRGRRRGREKPFFASVENRFPGGIISGASAEAPDERPL